MPTLVQVLLKFHSTAGLRNPGKNLGKPGRCTNVPRHCRKAGRKTCFPAALIQGQITHAEMAAVKIGLGFHQFETQLEKMPKYAEDLVPNFE